jgi:hypothetical protein
MSTQPAAGPSEIDDAMPPPFIMNCWKHHARTILARIDRAVGAGEAAVRELPQRLLQIGDALMDLYLGELKPEEIARQTLDHLQQAGIAEPVDFARCLASSDGYTFTSIRRATHPTRFGCEPIC